MFKCPSCEQEVTTVNVSSECLQHADIDNEGRISNFGRPYIGITMAVYCPLCDEEIMFHTSEFNKDNVSPKLQRR